MSQVLGQAQPRTRPEILAQGSGLPGADGWSWQSISNEGERIIVRFRRPSQGDEPLLRFDRVDYPSDLNDQVIPQE